MSIKRFFTRKPINELIEEAKNSHDLDRTLGAFQLILLGIGAIIGAGIFVFTGTAAAEHAGPAVTISFALSGIACACAGLCYAELASTIPIAGGPYTYTYAAIGEVAAWLVTGMILLTYILGAASVASGWSGYVISFLNDYGLSPPIVLSYTHGKIITLADGTTVQSIINLPALLIVLLLTSVVYRGAEASAAVNSVIVAIKMTVILAFIIMGANFVEPNNWVPFIPENTGKFGEFGLSGIIGGAAVIFLAFTGFDAVATAAQEAKNPQRDLPIGILGSLVICTVIYILVSGVLTGLAHYSVLGVPEPMAIAVDKMGMPWFSTMIKIGAIAGLTSVILVLIYGVVRVLYTVTHDGLLPIALAKINKKHHTPHILTITVGLVIATLASVIPVDRLVKLANFGTLVTFAMVCFATLYLRYKEPNLQRVFKCPLVPYVPIAGILIFITILSGLPTEIFIYAGIWITFLLIVYLTYGQFNSKLQKEIQEGVVSEATILD